MKSDTLGFIGLGAIGFPMCYALAKNGFKMILPTYRNEGGANSGYSPLAPNREKKLALIDEMVKAGASRASSQAELITGSNVVVSCLPSSKEVEELVAGPGGLLEHAKPGTIFIDLTTADPESSKKLGKLLEAKGVEMLDAPVSGGLTGAINRTLSVMVGGKEEVFEACRPILESIGQKEKIVYIGPSGSGNTMKVVNNFLSGLATLATTEAMMVAVKSGIPARKALEVLKDGSGRNDATMHKFPNMVLPGKSLNFKTALLCKDLALFKRTAQELDVPAFVSNLVYELWHLPLAQGKGELDTSELIKMYEDWCGVKLFGLERKD